MVSVFLTGDLAFQAMVLGRESMSGQHCMLCKLSRKEFDEYKDKDKNGIPWTTDALVEIGTKVGTPEQGGRPISGVKKPPWWPFIKMEHVMVPLLHCLIGIGNNLLDRFCDIVNEYIEKLSPAEIKLMRALTNYDIIIAETIQSRDLFDKSPEGKKMKSLQVWLKKKVGDHARPRPIVPINPEILQKEEELMPLLKVREAMADRINRTRQLYSDTQKNLRTLQSSKAKSATSLETSIFKVLKGIGVEQSSYHGGSLTGKDIKKVMNNSTYLFEEFASILKLGKRDDCEFSNDTIDTLCQHYHTVFLLWDGAFASARKINPTPEDAKIYEQFVEAAVAGHLRLGLTITPKVHLMLKHVRLQMVNIDGGLGNKMEDWVEKQHQMGKRERMQFRTMQNLQNRANARARVLQRNSDPVVVCQTLEVNGASKRKFNGERGKKEGIEASREMKRETKRLKALNDYGSSIKKEEMSLTFLWILSGGATKKPEEEKPKSEGTKPEGSTSRGEGGGAPKRVRVRTHDVMSE